MTVLESDIESYLVKRAVAFGGQVRKVKWIGRRGAPDRLVLMPYGWGQTIRWPIPKPWMAVWVELKRPGETPRQEQLDEHFALRAAGMRVEVIDSIQGVDKLLS